MAKRYIIGDIHGEYENLNRLVNQVADGFHPEKDKIIFLGDYVSYGEDSFKVIDFLISLSKQVSTVFLLGDHDQAFLEFLNDPDNKMSYLQEKGGNRTLESYERELGTLRIPKSHVDFFDNLKLTYEEEDFFCVHAGLNPKQKNIREQKINELLTIGEPFYYSKRVWKKLIIFGHTCVEEIHDQKNIPYFDRRKNLLGLDTGSGRGGRLTCYEYRTQRFF